MLALVCSWLCCFVVAGCFSMSLSSARRFCMSKIPRAWGSSTVEGIASWALREVDMVLQILLKRDKWWKLRERIFSWCWGVERQLVKMVPWNEGEKKRGRDGVFIYVSGMPWRSRSGCSSITCFWFLARSLEKSGSNRGNELECFGCGCGRGWASLRYRVPWRSKRRQICYTRKSATSKGNRIQYKQKFDMEM